MVLSLHHCLVLIACGAHTFPSQAGRESSMTARLRFWTFSHPAERIRLVDEPESVPSPDRSKHKISSQMDAALSLLLLLRPALSPNEDLSTEPCGPCENIYEKHQRRNTDGESKDSETQKIIMDAEDWSESAFSTMGMIWGSGAMSDDWIERVNEMTSL